MKIIQLCIIILLLTHTTAAKPKFKDLKMKKHDCQNYDACKFDKTENCLNRCLSEKCYADFYAKNPVEEGQIDRDRNRAFNDCLKAEEREMRNK